MPSFEAVWLLPAFERSLEALCRREPKLRAKVWKTLDRFLTDLNALERKPLRGARRRVFRTKVDGGNRLIDEPLGPLLPREVAALYVGHHDANEWGAEYDDDTAAKLEWATRRGGSITSEGGPQQQRRVSESVPPTYGHRRKSHATWWEDRRQTSYGDVLSARELKARGVPEELVPDVLAASDSVDLTTLGLAPDIADKVDNWYLSKLPSCPVSVHVPSAGEPGPLRATRAELAGILRLPLYKFLATLTDDQRRLAERDSDRLFVVRGAAGSGKTVVGIRRIEWWIRQRDLFEKRPILFTCYNKVLAHAARQMLEDVLGQDLRAAGVEVTTAFKLMSDLQLELEGERFAKFASRPRLLRYIREARSTTSLGSVEQWTDEQLLDEILEVIFARVLTSEEQYLAADRSGRGREQRLDPKARSAVWRLFREFRRRCRADGVAPWDQLPARLAGLLERAPRTSPRYAAIVVDEVQDLPPSVLRVLLALQAGEDRNMLVLGDAAQNVYRNGFRWAHTGLKVVGGGQVATLRRCFRSTPAIVGAATPLIRRQHARFDDDLTMPEASGDPGPPVRIRLYKTSDEELQAIAEDIGVQIENGVPPSSIGVLLDDTAARRRLREFLSHVDCRSEDFIKPGGAKLIDIFDPSVKLLTTGSAKGIEFQVLFVPAVTERQYPSTDLDGETADRARRVLYTAMMRCAYELQLSSTAGDASALLKELDGTFIDRRGQAY